MTSLWFVIRIWLIHFFITYGINRTTLLLTKHYLLILISGLHCLHVKLRYNLRKMDINASVTLVIRAPNQRIEDHTVECMLGWTVKKLKKHLEDVYPSNPVSTQRYLQWSWASNLFRRSVKYCLYPKFLFYGVINVVI